MAAPKLTLRRGDLEFTEQSRALRADVHWLGEMTGELLREQGGERLFELVETARQLAIRRREGDTSTEVSAELHKSLAGLDAATADDVARAFSTYFHLVNTAEKVHRIRRRRDYLRDESKPAPRGLDRTLNQLRAADFSLDELQALLDRLQIEPVFTGQPTEPTRRTILRKEQNIVRILVSMLDTSLPPQERRALEAKIRSEITTIWQTDENPSEAMTVADELEHVLFFLTDVLYRVVPPVYENLRESLTRVYGEESKRIRLPMLFRFASWVGGDLDGNPNVNAKTIRNTLARQRSLVLNLYFAECGRLAEQLSQTLTRTSVTEGVLERIAEYKQHFPDAMQAIPLRHREMPYRVYLRLIQARIRSTFDDSVFPYTDAAEFVADIRRIEVSLAENRGLNAGHHLVRRFLRRVQTFGFHLLTLDVRQDARVHRKVVGTGLGDADWLQRSPEERADAICTAIENREPPDEDNDTLTRKTLAVFQAIAYCRRRYGENSIGPFIISRCEGPDDVLSVLLLAQWGELANRKGEVALDIAPMFETVRDLETGSAVIQTLIANPRYRRHLALRGNRQPIMLGYSTSNKDSGIAASRWALYQAQQSLVHDFDDTDIEIALFHGRGGSISRGGSNTRSAVLSSPPGTINGKLRVTEQGETINEKYGLRDLALRNLEQSIGAVSWASREAKRNVGLRTDWVEAIRRIAAESRRAYRDLVYETPQFLDYFRAATPIDVIEHMQVGTHPPTDRRGRGIDSLRAIPWVFAWTQSRQMLPGWYGVGSGLAAAIEAFGQDRVTEMFQEWPFAKNLLHDVEIVLAKADPGIAAEYSALAGELDERILPIIEAEFAKTQETVLALTGHGRLLEDDRVLRRAIRLRNPYLDPMSLLQIDLLKRWRAGERQDQGIKSALFETVNGIVQGLQATG
ncbi:MAG: phosphoenolpyruvate carboxylase [Pseudomonadota bacterium]